MSDVTGELGRYCVDLAISKQNPAKCKILLESILNFMQEIYDEYLYLYPDSESDKKITAIGFNIKKVRDLLFQMSISRPRKNLSEMVCASPENKKAKVK